MTIRLEQPPDRGAIYAVHTQAFGKGQQPVPEAVLWDLLHDAGDVRADLSFVATLDDRVIGHAGSSRGYIGETPVVALGPVGVRPDQQANGIGISLVQAVVAAADAAGEPVVVLLGDPRFYGRFGFELAAPLGVLPPDPAWAEFAFQLRRLSAWDPAMVGDFRYAPAFSTV